MLVPNPKTALKAVAIRYLVVSHAAVDGYSGAHFSVLALPLPVLAALVPGAECMGIA